MSLEFEGDYWAIVQPLYRNISIHQDPASLLEQLAGVTRAGQVLFAAHWCQTEVLNGGLWQFFMNSTGVLCPEAIEAYSAIGMPKLSSVLSDAASWFGPEYPRATRERRALLSAAGWARPRGNPFGKQTKLFLKLHEEEAGGFDAAADRFAAESSPE